MKNEALKTIEKLGEVVNFLEEDGDIKYYECIDILNKLDEIKKTIMSYTVDKADEVL